MVPGKDRNEIIFLCYNDEFMLVTGTSYLLADKSQFIGSIEDIQLLLGQKVCGYFACEMCNSYLN